MSAAPRPFRSGQRGLTLIVVMLILVVVMILGAGGAQIALMSERSTRYDRDYLIASQAAEAALMDAEIDITGSSPTPITNRSSQFTQANTGFFKVGCGTDAKTTLGLCQPATGPKPIWAVVDLTNPGIAVPYGLFTGRTLDVGKGIQSAQLPNYIIEVVPDMGPGSSAAAGTQQYMYRITAIGFGPRQEVQVVMQTAFRN